MSELRIRVIKGPIAPIRRVTSFWDEYMYQPLYNVRLINGRVVSTFRDFLEEESNDLQEKNNDELIQK